MDKRVKLKWLNNSCYKNTGVTWGMPWKEGTLKRQETLSLCGENGKKIAFKPGLQHTGQMAV
jgi:hypothetical protein